MTQSFNNRRHEGDGNRGREKGGSRRDSGGSSGDGGSRLESYGAPGASSGGLSGDYEAVGSPGFGGEGHFGPDGVFTGDQAQAEYEAQGLHSDSGVIRPGAGAGLPAYGRRI